MRTGPIGKSMAGYKLLQNCSGVLVGNASSFSAMKMELRACQRSCLHSGARDGERTPGKTYP